MIPNPEPEERGGLEYFDNYFQKLNVEDTGYNERFAIPNQYIRGYVDVRTQKFIPNPSFDPQKIDYNPTPKVFIPRKVAKPPTPAVTPSTSISIEDDVW